MPDGSTRRQHLEKAEAQAGEALFQEPEVAPDTAFLLDLYRDLIAGAELPLTYQAIAAWRDLTGAPVGPEDVTALLALGRAHRSWLDGRSRKAGA